MPYSVRPGRSGRRRICPLVTTPIPESCMKYVRPWVPQDRFEPPPPFRICVASPFLRVNNWPWSVASHTSPLPSTHVNHIFVVDDTLAGTRLACSNRLSPPVPPIQIFPFVSCS